MATEEQIRELAHSVWKQEGHPEGRDVEHYFRARRLLEEREAARVFELAPPPPGKRRTCVRRKKSGDGWPITNRGGLP
jgi:hypothetical protein